MAIADDFLIAAEWLDYNDGTDGESDSCHRVATWLRDKAKRDKETRSARRVSKIAGVTIGRARQAIRRAAQKDTEASK